MLRTEHITKLLGKGSWLGESLPKATQERVDRSLAMKNAVYDFILESPLAQNKRQVCAHFRISEDWAQRVLNELAGKGKIGRALVQKPGTRVAYFYNLKTGLKL